MYRDLRPDDFKLKSHELRITVLREQLRSQVRKRKELADRAPKAEPVQPPAEPKPIASPDQVVAIVSGLPRSGTSMMMQMLVAGGIAAYTDDGRPPDADNPRGYFEHDLATRLASNNQWLPEVRGKVVKIVAPLLPKLPETESYAIVMMNRDLGEVVASQREMLNRLERKGTSLTGEQLKQALRREMDHVDRWIAKSAHVRVLHLNYGDVLADAAGACRKLCEFLGRTLDSAAMERAVQPSLRRQQSGTAASE